MACVCAPSLRRLRAEIDHRWPDRDKASDGCCGDAVHAARTSDHNPNADGYARALDVDEDLTPNGPGPDDLLFLAEWWMAHPDKRVKYLIYERALYYPQDGVRPRGKYAYTGTNPHDHHLHVSIFDSAVHSTAPWLDGLALPSRPIPPPEVFDMTPAELTDVLAKVFRGEGISGAGNVQAVVDQLAAVAVQVAAVRAEVAGLRSAVSALAVEQGVDPGALHEVIEAAVKEALREGTG